MTKNNHWWSQVEVILAEKSLLKHPFYQAWTMGALTAGDLALYAEQYYQQESRFPRYVAEVLARCEDGSAKAALSENLAEETGQRGTPSHPELWLRFAESAGASRACVLAAQATPETRECVSTFERLTRSDWARGLAALYAYEVQQPAVAAAKIDGLTSRYGLGSEASLGFFRVHQSADVWHSQVEKDALLKGVGSGSAKPEVVVESVRLACDALNRLLDGVWARCEARTLAAC